MANTISNITIANTFGDWVSTTVQTVNELNYIGTQDWTKTAGTLYINSNGTSLDVANNAYFRKQLIVTGIGSGLTVYKNADVRGVLYLTNLDTDANPDKLIFSANGVANVNYINITGDGLAANVVNNMFVGGTLDVTGNTSVSANVNVTGDAFANNVIVTNNLTVGENAEVAVDLTVENNTFLLDDVFASKNIVSNLKVIADDLIANDSIIGTNLNLSGKLISSNLVSNTTISTPSANIGTLFFDNLEGIGGTFGASQITANVGYFGSVTVDGNFVISGDTVYNTDIITVNASASANLSATLASYRPGGSNAEFRWFESGKYWDVRDVENPTRYNRLLTANDYSSINTSFSQAISANVTVLNDNISANVLTLNTNITNANTSMKSYVDSNVVLLQGQISANAVSTNAVISTANSFMKIYVDDSNTKNILYTNAQISANAVSANAVIVKANTDMKNYVDTNFLRAAGGGGTQTIAGDVLITGGLTVSGTTSYVNSTTVTVQDSLIRLANNNTSSDLLDIGFYAPYFTGGFTRYTGLFRKAGSGVYYLAQAIVNDPTANSVSNFGTSYRATLDANFTGGTISGLSNPLGLADGGTGATSASGALTSLLTASAGTGSAGQVLTTAGAGSYYWSTVATGGGSSQGTTINSSRLTYIVGTNATAGETRFTAPTYVVGAGQTRVYINGVRQFLSDYTEANTTAIILNPGLVAGDTMVIEVDGYTTYTQLASATSFSPTGDISSTTVQNAIAELDSEKASLNSPAFIGLPTAPTAPITTGNTVIATTAYVNNLANSNYTFTHNITGNAGTVTNGLYSTSTYSDPSWITSLAGSKISGSVASATSATSATTASNLDGGTTGALPYQSGTGTSAFLSLGSSGQVLTAGASGPQWTSASSVGGFPSGTSMLFAQTNAPTGWTKSTTHNDKAIRVVSGAASSGGSVAFSTAFASQAVSGSIGSTTATGSVSLSLNSGTLSVDVSGLSAGATTLTTTQLPKNVYQLYGTTAGGLTNTFDAASTGLSSAGTSVGGPQAWNNIKTTGQYAFRDTNGGGSHTHTMSGSATLTGSPSGSASFSGTSHNHTFSGTAINLAVQYVDVIIATKD